MSVREEDRRKNNCPSSRGLGIAAAAIGVGVGAALYYYFSRRPEQGESSSEEWNCEQQQQALREEEQLRIIREQAFRERKWSLEECSICFDVMLKDQQLMQLPCTHNFHVACIGPWLKDRQTCPVCRKPVE